MRGKSALHSSMDNIHRSQSPDLSKKSAPKEKTKQDLKEDKKKVQSKDEDSDEEPGKKKATSDEKDKQDKKPEMTEEERSRVKKLHLADLQQKQVESAFTRTKKFLTYLLRNRSEIERELSYLRELQILWSEKSWNSSSTWRELRSSRR